MKKILACVLSLALYYSPLQAAIVSRPNSFTNGTTIDATQVNSNENTIYNDYNGNIDSTNILNGGIAYADLSTAMQQYWNYRRPNLQYLSTGTVTVETGLNGTAGQLLIVFRDGTIRTDSTASRIVLTMTQTASLSGTKRSGLRTGSIANNTWYAVYAVEATDDSTSIVIVADTVLPLVANASTLNSNFTAGQYVYLGLIRVGSNGMDTSAGSIVKFVQTGNVTMLCGASATPYYAGLGFVVSDTASNPKTFTFTYGTGTTDIPNNMTFGYIMGFIASGSAGPGDISAGDASRAHMGIRASGGTDATTGFTGSFWAPVMTGGPITTLSLTTGSSSYSKSIALIGWIDGALSGGPNALF